MRKYTAVLAVLCFLVGFGAASGMQEKITPREVMERSTSVTKLPGSEAVSTLTIMDGKGRERVRRIAMVTKLYDNGDTEKKLTRFLAPADVKGTGLLSFDYINKEDDMWLFMPAIRKTRRIVSSEKAKSFMGSEFSYADMNPPALDDFRYKDLGDQEVAGVICWTIEMVPVNDDIADENGFSRKVAYIGKEDFMIRKSVTYDLDGELHKELTILEIKQLDAVNHKYRPMHMVMENKQNNRKSIMKVEEIQLNPEVKDEYFTSRYLERF